MSISLTPELEAFVQERAAAYGFNSPDDFVRQTLQRIMAEEKRHENAVNEGLRSGHAPLTQDELAQVRKLASGGGGSS